MQKVYAYFVTFCVNFPNYCAVDVFSLGIFSKVVEESFQLLAVAKRGIKVKEHLRFPME